MRQTEEHEFYSGLIIKIGARYFFCNKEGHFRMNCPMFWESVKNQSHPIRKLALAAVQNTRNRQAEFDTKNTTAKAINKVKQDLATREIEQRLKQEIERQKLNETLSMSMPMPEVEVVATRSGNCNTLKMVTGKTFGLAKIGARIMSIITEGGHEVTRNLGEPSDQTIMHIDVYAD